MKVATLFLTVLAACLLCTDTEASLTVHHITAPLLTAFLTSWPTAFLLRRIQTATQLAVGEGVILLCLTDCFCQEFFATPISPQILSNVLLSDSREAGEFFSTFIGFHVLMHWRITVLLLLGLAFPIALTCTKKEMLLPKKCRYAVGGMLSLCIVCEAPATIRYAQLFLQNDDLLKIEGLIFRHYHEEIPTPLHRYLFSQYALGQSSRFLNDIKQATFSAKPDSCSFLSPHIVLVIGESYNKHHSSLYGYRLPTAPLQEKRRQRGELFVFSDAVSPWNITSNAFMEIFSLWQHGMQQRKAETPLFPILFRRAGYNVNFFSNQYQLHGFRKGATNQAGHFFLADEEMSDSLFTFRNRKSERYDARLARSVKDFKQKQSSSEYTLDIIHLIGQHFEYSERYPHAEAFFTTSDYQDRKLSQKDKRIVMHYDNATRYNDMVLDSIISIYENEEAIMLFIADHGEEVYDELPVHGRLFREPTAAQARNEYEIPMWIWCSERYRQVHPEVVDNIKQSQEKPFMTDGVPQILLALAGISCRWTDDTRNLLSPRYQAMPRIIGGNIGYDELLHNVKEAE